MGYLMKYYLYVSETKVGMLHSQIGVSLFSKVKAGIKLKLPFFFEASLDADSETKTIYAKVEEIRNQILAGGECGTIERPKSYVDDTALLSFGSVTDYAASIAFFGGIVGGKKVALIGSSSSLVGAAKVAEADHRLDYYTIKFMAEMSEGRLHDKFRAAPPEPAEIEDDLRSLEESVEQALGDVNTPPRRLSFTAKVIHDTSNFLVASPIFVAMA